MKVLVAAGLMAIMLLGGWVYQPAAPKVPVVSTASIEVEIAVPPIDLTQEMLLAVSATQQATAAIATEAPKEAASTSAEDALPEPETSRIMLSDEVVQFLETHGWAERVGAGLGVWVSVEHQRFFVLRQGEVVFDVRCATAEKGVGSEGGSNKTPLGWHSVVEKFGEGAAWGQVFRSRVATRERWKPGGNPVEDLVLTRVLWLDGLEPGVNKGKNAAGRLVDSKERCIYIHGTNAEERIGTPSSHGCVRLLNEDVIKAFALIPQGTPVLITE